MRIGKRTFDGTALAALAVLFVGIIMLSNVLLRGARIDLTENGLYSVSDGTRKILDQLEEPINLYFFFSENVAAENTETPYVGSLRRYAQRVREMLEEFVLHAEGEIRLTVIDPQPFSEEEDRATNFGLQSIPAGAAGDPLYFGLAGTNVVDDTALVPYFQPDKEPFLEYDLAKLIYGLAHPERQVIGLMSWLPVQSGFDPASGRMREPWVIANQLEQLFELRRIELAAGRIDADVDVLLLVHPKDVSRETQYAIDQFVLRGGKTMIFVDPHADSDTAGADPNNPYAAMTQARSSNLPQLFEAWGIQYDPASVVIDRRLALSVQTQPNAPPQRHLGYLQFTPAQLDGEDVVTVGLEAINGSTVGHFAVAEDASLELMPLIRSSDEATTVPASRFQFLPDPAGLREGYTAAGEPFVVAARLRGQVDSAFDAPPPGDDASSAADGEEAGADEQPTHLAASEGPVNLILVADTDLLTDRFWVQTQSFFGQRLVSAFADNGNFVANGLDNLTGSDELISIRAQATFTRPFDKVDALERAAEERFLATEQRLESELAETERKLSELQSSRQDDDNLLILTPEQRAEIERFQEEKLRIRRELRDVRRDLDRSIEQLGTVLKLINVGLLPVLITVLGLSSLLLRTRRGQHGRGGST